VNKRRGEMPFLQDTKEATMAETSVVPDLVKQKLAAFERLQSEFEACFQFVEEVHGQRRFSTFPVADTVRYLHALWICECKASLLSVFRTVKEYEGMLCLELLRKWQKQQDTASVVAFLQRRLDMLPFAEITRKVHEAQHVHANDGLAQRLAHGRLVLLNRGINLMQALDALFALPEAQLFEQVHAACESYGHLPAQIEQQLEEMKQPLFAYVPHQALAQRNMVVMNNLGINVTWRPEDLPGERSWRVLPPTPKPPATPFAEHIVQSYQELVTPVYNNPRRQRFVDRPERSETGEVR
jgi:hypothetical protein